MPQFKENSKVLAHEFEKISHKRLSFKKKVLYFSINQRFPKNLTKSLVKKLQQNLEIIEIFTVHIYVHKLVY